MSRRIAVALTAVLGIVGALVLSSTTASAQLPGFNLLVFLQQLFNAFPTFLRGIIGAIIALLSQLFGGACLPPFCAS